MTMSKQTKDEIYELGALVCVFLFFFIAQAV